MEGLRMLCSREKNKFFSTQEVGFFSDVSRQWGGLADGVSQGGGELSGNWADLNFVLDSNPRVETFCGSPVLLSPTT